METPTDELRRADRAARRGRAGAGRLGARARPRPAVGDDGDADGRVYLDHSRDIGAFNPSSRSTRSRSTATGPRGTVEFPIVYEGPPGIVHGGFLAVFFDSVVQHHNCDVGVAGKTTRLDVSFRRPTPLLTPLTFDIERAAQADRIESHARLRRGDVLCAEATMQAIAGDRAALPAVSPRRHGP